MAATEKKERRMPKYLLLKHYRGGPEPMPSCVPMSEWTPEEIRPTSPFSTRWAGCSGER